MKRFLGVLLLVVGLFFMVACEKEKDDPNKNGNGKQNEMVFDQALKTEYHNLLQGKKLYLTTAGQADLNIVENILNGAGLASTEYTSKALLKASEVETGSAVILVIGASGKGLGDAGTNVPAEVVRVEEFGAKQTSGDITLVVVHVGGEGRTGAQSNPIIEAAIPVAKLALVVDTKTQNHIFTSAVGSSKVELVFFSKATALITPFKTLLGL
ncbi:MAG: DUF6305 family protein [Acholeplasmataceae bacterium]|jgi:hypothetical protein